MLTIEAAVRRIVARRAVRATACARRADSRSRHRLGPGGNTTYIAVPIFLPIFAQAGVDLVWLATLVCVMLQASFLTPPFCWALCFLCGVAPFVAMQLLAVLLVFLFPTFATRLLRAIGWQPGGYSVIRSHGSRCTPFSSG
jgi:hypothetical protein